MTPQPITPAKGLQKEPPKKPTPPKETIITRVPYPKWWNQSKTAPIGLSGSGATTPIKQRPGFSIYVATIVITVSKSTQVTFVFGIYGPSGTMNFGATDEPKGIVIAMGNSPAPIGAGPFQVTSTASDSVVGGFVVYYEEKDIKVPEKPVKK